MLKNKNKTDNNRELFNKMTFKDKVGYIFEYYKIHMISVLLLLVFIISIIWSITSNNYTNAFSSIIVNGKLTGVEYHTDQLTNGFTSYLGIDGKSSRVTFSNDYIIKPGSNDEDTKISNQKIATMSTSETLDGIICDYQLVNYFSDDNSLLLIDLSTILTPQEMSKLSSYMVYHIASDGTKIPVAIELTNTHIKTETDLSIQKPCFGVISSSNNKDNAVKFIRYAFNMD